MAVPMKVRLANSASAGSLTATAPTGDGAVLLAFDHDPSAATDLAGFGIECVAEATADSPGRRVTAAWSRATSSTRMCRLFIKP